MSRFFKKADESSSDSSSESENEVAEVKQSVRHFDFSDSEDEKRVVKSAKDKRFEEIQAIIKKMTNFRRIGDWNQMSNAFEDLVRVVSKSKSVFASHGSTPRFLVRALVELEDAIKVAFENKKKLNSQNAKALTAMKQKVRKHNKPYEEELAAFRADPSSAEKKDEAESSGDDEAAEAKPAAEAAASKPKSKASAFLKSKEGGDDSDDSSSEEESSEEESSDDDDDDAPRGGSKFLRKPVAKKEEPAAAPAAAKKADGGDSGDDSSDMWGSDGDTESSSEDDGEPRSGRSYFLKKEPTAAATATKKKPPKAKPPKPVPAGEGEDGGWVGGEEGAAAAAAAAEKAAAAAKSKDMFPKGEDITVDMVLNKMTEIMAQRGKRGTDSLEYVDLLRKLRKIALAEGMGLGVNVKILLAMIAGQFDVSHGALGYMSVELWKKCHDYIVQLLDLLLANPNITLGEHITEEQENVRDDKKPFLVSGSLIAFVERLDEEFVKSLQAIDPHTPDYVSRLKDEHVFYTLIVEAQKYAERVGNTHDMCRVYMRRVEHLYYKFDRRAQQDPSSSDAAFLWPLARKADAEAAATATPTPTPKKEGGEVEGEASAAAAVPSILSEDSRAVIDRLCKYLYVNDKTDRMRTRAMLCHIYHHALHDRWFLARDMLLMSHLQETISHADVPTQILFNRTMVQLGLCAFRTGHIKESHQALSDILSTGRVKELVAQGILNQRFHEKTPEQEKKEKRRLMPFHMHINLELLECVFLTAAMLLEVPLLAAHRHDRRVMISKPFRRLLDMSRRQLFHGPPENTREHVMSAARALALGKWEEATKLICSITVWNLVPNADRVKEMIGQKIKEEGLRTYMFNYSCVYESISLADLADMFQLPKETVHSLVSKLIISEELQASWDQPTHSIIIHNSDPTRLQGLALQFSDRATQFVEHNERLLDSRNHSGGYNAGWKGGRDGGAPGGGFRGNEGGGSYDRRSHGGYGGGHRSYGGRDGGSGAGRGSGGRGWRRDGGGNRAGGFNARDNSSRNRGGQGGTGNAWGRKNN